MDTKRHSSAHEGEASPFAALAAWMAEHVGEIAHEWDNGPGRASWVAFAEGQPQSKAAVLREGWLKERGRCIRNWTLAAAIEQGIVGERDAVVYAMSEGICGYPRGAPAQLWAA